MSLGLDIVYLRRPILNYISPPVCEVIFSGSSNPVIILSNNPLTPVTGLALGGFSGFRLTWNAYPGAICFNIYFIAEGTTVAVLLAECVQPGYELPNPGPGDGEITVTPITPDDGEGPPAPPIPYPTPGGGGTSTVIVEAVCAQTSKVDFPATFKISREVGDTIGNLVVNYTMSGTAVNGVDYDTIPLQATIPNGSNFVIIDIVPKEEVLVGDKTVTMSLTESFSYALGLPSVATLAIRLPLLFIPGYGTTEPLFTPPATSINADYCEWDGTFNTFVAPFVPGGIGQYYYQDDAGQLFYIRSTIQGKAIFSVAVAGPFNFPSAGSWQVAIYTLDSLNNQEIVWQGLKQGGDTTSPEGTYNWNGAGSDHRGTLEIEVDI